MNIIFDELKQYIINEVKEKIKLDDYDYFNLKCNSKYLVCFYDKNNELICCKYPGYYISTEYEYDTYLGYDLEGYFFSQTLNPYSSTFKSNHTTHCVVKEIYEDDEKKYSHHKFFELEHTFDCNTMDNIYKYVISNIEPNMYGEIHFEYSYDLNNEIALSEIFIESYGELNNYYK